MTASILATTLLWAVAGIIVLAAIGCVLVKRAAARLLLAALAALVGLVVLGAHLQVQSLMTGHADALCRDGVHWFGVTLTAPADRCPAP